MGLLDVIDNLLGTRLGLLVNDPRAAMSQMNQQAGAYNQASMLATQAERNSIRGLPVTPEQAAAKQYVDKIAEDLAMGFAGSVNPTRKAALDIASQNAEKMLGLPKGNTQMDRAKAMGFDMNMYHGTDVPLIEAFDPEKTKIIKGIFTTNEPKTASKYAIEAGLKNRAESFGMESSPNVLPLLIKSESHARLPKFDKQTIDMFKNLGNQGVYRDEMGVAVTFDPSQIRSRFAAFDPARVNDTDLLAAGVPLGLLAGTNIDIKKKTEKKK